MKNLKAVPAGELHTVQGKALRLASHTASVAGAVWLLCATAHGESAWSRIARALSGQPDQQMATAEKPSLAPGLPMIPVENGATSGTAQTGKTEITGLALDTTSGGLGKLDLGKESEEGPVAATDLFKKPEILRLLGDQPRFVYEPAERPDPMLVPWVRNAAIFAELSGAADIALKAGNMDEAIGLYERILAMKDPRYVPVVQAKLMEINNAKAVAAAKQAELSGQMLVKIELPAWVADNTTGVIDGGGQGMALVGDDLLKVGQPLPRYPEIKIASINGKKVVYEIQGKTFEVELKEPEK